MLHGLGEALPLRLVHSLKTAISSVIPSVRVEKDVLDILLRIRKIEETRLSSVPLKNTDCEIFSLKPELCTVILSKFVFLCDHFCVCSAHSPFDVCVFLTIF